MLGFPILYFKGTRIMMFQLSGFYCKPLKEPLKPRSATVYLSSRIVRKRPRPVPGEMWSKGMVLILTVDGQNPA